MPLQRQEDLSSYGFSGKTLSLIVNIVLSHYHEIISSTIRVMP
jgi:hypothetical protein